MSKSFDQLVAIMKRLKAPDGCPWDKEQTHKSLIPYLIEESYEVVDAILEEDPKQLKEELGDFLLQFVFHAQIGEENQHFTTDEIIEKITQKLIRRHPHVFDPQFKKNQISEKELAKNWERIKQEELTEKQKEGQKIKNGFASVPKELPALFEAYKLIKKQKKMANQKAKPQAKDNREQILKTIQEAQTELFQAIDSQNNEKVSELLGKILFESTRLACQLKINPEIALKEANHRFRKQPATQLD